MKLNKFYPLLIIAAFVAMVFDSCSPTPTGIDPTTLLVKKTGTIIKLSTDTNTYRYSLSCGCDFELGVVDADTTHGVLYDTGNIAIRDASHTIKAFAKKNLTKGTYTGWLAVVTLKPDTQDDFRDTLRDTVIVP